MRLSLSVQNYVNFLGATPHKERMTRIRKQDVRILYRKWAKDLDQYLKGRRRFFPKKPKPKEGFIKFYLARMRGENVDLFEQFSKRVQKSIKQVTRENNPLKQDELTQHYREFRSRFHLGVPATETMTIAPLSGALMDQVVQGQINIGMHFGTFHPYVTRASEAF